MNEATIKLVSKLAIFAMGSEVLHLTGEGHMHREVPADEISPALAIEAQHYATSATNSVVASLPTFTGPGGSL